MVREEGEGLIVERFECRTRTLGLYFIGDGEPLKSFLIEHGILKIAHFFFMVKGPKDQSLLHSII